MTSSLSVGQEFLCHCAKCNLELAHIIITMKGNEPGKVQCKTCQSVHTFKPKIIKKRGKRKSTQVQHLENWSSKMQSGKQEAPIDYSPTKKFEIGDIIRHPTFGDGIVNRLIDNNKIEIVFEADSKFLVHNK